MAIRNIRYHYEDDGKTLVLKVDLRRNLGLTASQKNVLVATTGSKFGVPLPEGETVNLSVFRGVDVPVPAGQE